MLWLPRFDVFDNRFEGAIEIPSPSFLSSFLPTTSAGLWSLLINPFELWLQRFPLSRHLCSLRVSLHKVEKVVGTLSEVANSWPWKWNRLLLSLLSLNLLISFGENLGEDYFPPAIKMLLNSRRPEGISTHLRV